MKNRKYTINCFLPVFIILAQYNVVYGYSLGLVLIFILSMIDLIKHKIFILNKSILFFVITCILLQLVIHKSSYGIATFIIVLFIFIAEGDKIDESELYRFFKIFGSIAIGGLFYHSVQLYVFGINVSPIKLIPLIGEIANENWYNDGLRPTSFFAEPQAFASYMMPFLFLSLKRREYFWAILITVSVLLSTSTQGLVMMIILWVGHSLFAIKQTKIKLSVFVFLSFFILLFLFSPIFEYSRTKIIETEISGNPRISRGFEVFLILDFRNIISGIGFGNVGNYVYNVSNEFDWAIGNNNISALNYTSGFSGLLVQFGLISGLVFFVMLFKLWIKGNRVNRVFLFMIFVSFFSQNIVLNAWFIYFFLFYLSISVQKNNLNNSDKFKI